MSWGRRTGKAVTVWRLAFAIVVETWQVGRPGEIG
jgi:hypothetical protein